MNITLATLVLVGHELSSGASVYVNPNLVASITSTRDATELCTINSKCYELKESVDDVIRAVTKK